MVSFYFNQKPSTRQFFKQDKIIYKYIKIVKKKDENDDDSYVICIYKVCLQYINTND